MAADPIAAKVLSSIAAVKHIPVESLSAESKLAELGLDSLDTMNLLFELEETFQITVPDDQARHLQTIGDVIEGIRRLLEPNAPQNLDGGQNYA